MDRTVFSSLLIVMLISAENRARLRCTLSLKAAGWRES